MIKNEAAMINSTCEKQETSLEEQLKKMAPLVKQIARHLMMRLPHSVQFDDLVQVGMIGLLESIKNFDDSKGASIETYAGIRIRGMMIDEVRRNNWAPRSVHKKAKIISEKIKELEHISGRVVSDREIAASLNIDLNEYHQMLYDASGTQLFAIEDMMDDENISSDTSATEFIDLSEELHQKNMKKKLSEIIKDLPEREQLVLSLYYDEGFNLKEIGKIIGVSESRVCQLHTQSMCRIQSKVKQWLENSED